jgi:hypothetical protein
MPLGVRILWWARAGKLISAIAGLVIIIDIVGEERLRRYGSTILLLTRLRGTHVGPLSIIIIVFFIDLTVLIYFYDWILNHLLFIFSFGSHLLTVGIEYLFEIFVILSTLNVIFWLFLFTVFAIGHILSREQIATYFMSASLLMFLIGFHFDLLGS